MYVHMLHMLLYHLDHLIDKFTAFIVRGPKIDCSNCPIGELHIFYSWTICHKFKMKCTTAKVALGKIVIFQLLSFKSSECHFKKFKINVISCECYIFVMFLIGCQRIEGDFLEEGDPIKEQKDAIITV